MKITILISLLLLSILKLPHNKTPVIYSSKHSHLISIDTSKYAIIKFDANSNNIFDKSYKPTTLSNDDIIQIEKLIAKKILEINNEVKSKGVIKSDLIKNPEKYYKQFIPVINSKGEKEVWVNCFCSIEYSPNWKKNIVIVEDGGCYFQLKINLTKNILYDLTINGVG